MDTPQPRKKWRWLLWLLLTPFFLILCFVLAFFIWALTPQGPMPEAERYLQSDDQVEVVSGDLITFRPKGVNPDTGLIFYPGGRVNPASYAPAAYQIAESGYLVVIPHMAFNLPVSSPNRADAVMAHFPDVQHWIIGGHSLGGEMAAQYAYKHPGKVEGLVLWAGYPPSGASLADTQFPVLSIYGSNDANAATINASKALLPPDTVWVIIEGGNHGQLGWYGRQPGDNPATISREEEQRQAIEATIDFLNALHSPQ